MSRVLQNLRIRMTPVTNPGSPLFGKCRYRYANGIVAALSVGAPSWLANPYLGTMYGAAPGFATLSPSLGTTWYVSDNGSNSNSGTSPNATISLQEAINRHVGGDHILIECGSRFRNISFAPVNQINAGLKSGPSNSVRTLIGWYGDPRNGRPVLENNGTYYWYSLSNIKSNIYFRGINFYAFKHDINNPEFTGQWADRAEFQIYNACQNITFEDCLFDGSEVKTNDVDPGARSKNIQFLRCMSTGAYANTTSYSRAEERPSNFYIEGSDDVLWHQCVINRGGWNPDVVGAGANVLCHNIYGQHNNNDNIILNETFNTNASANGSQFRNGGQVLNSFYGRNAVGITLGYNQSARTTNPVMIAADNVVMEGHSMVKGIDACLGTVTQGINQCSSAVWGIDMSINGPAQMSRLRNIIAQQAPNDTQWQGTYTSLNRTALVKTGPDANVYPVTDTGNITYKWSNSSQGVGPNYVDPERSLTTYYRFLFDVSDNIDHFDDFIDLILHRPLQSWDDRYTTVAVNDYIRAGFAIA